MLVKYKPFPIDKKSHISVFFHQVGLAFSENGSFSSCFLHMYTCMCTYNHIRTYMYIFMCMYVRLLTYVYISTCIYVHVCSVLALSLGLMILAVYLS